MLPACVRFDQVHATRITGCPGHKMKILIPLIATASLAFAAGPQLIPTKEGTTWQYNMTQEVGEGLSLSGTKRDADGKLRAAVIYRIAGMQSVDGKDLLEFEMHRDGVVTNTDLITVDEHGIICWGRINLEGDLVELDPPQMVDRPPELAMRSQGGVRVVVGTTGEWEKQRGRRSGPAHDGRDGEPFQSVCVGHGLGLRSS